MAENNTTRESFTESVRGHALQLIDLVSELNKNGIKSSVLLIATCDVESGEGHRTTMGAFGMAENIINGLIDFAENDEDSKYAFNEAAGFIARKRMKGLSSFIDKLSKEIGADRHEQENNNTNKQEDY